MKNLIRIVLILFVHSVYGMVADPVLEKRLVEEKRYLIKAGDNWTTIAYKVYGHRSWWQRLQKKNFELSHYSKMAKLPEGREVWYKAPRVGRFYTVQKNDTFTRLLEWKYGGTKQWLKLLRLNRSQMRRYSQIEPGDQFEFLYSGRVVLLKKSDLAAFREKRTFESKVYKSIEGDTLKRIAYRVYGHRFWWPKLVDKNAKLKGYAANQKLSVGTKLLYQGPIIGSSYKVRKGDTLSRIALWKYGNFKLWNKIAGYNREILSNPDLIRVGDRIILKGLGEISIVKKSRMEAPIVLKTPQVVIPNVPKAVMKKVELPPTQAKVKPSGPSLMRFVPIVILSIIVVVILFLLMKLGREFVKKRAQRADKEFLKNLSSQRPVSAQKSKGAPKLFNRLRAVTDDGEYSHQIGYPEISKKVKFGRLFRRHRTS